MSIMRQEEIQFLSKPYDVEENVELNLFDTVIGADVPSVLKLAKEILNDVDRVAPGIRWWSNLAAHERILIGDYLYQCAGGIEVNLSEAKLHYFEFLDARGRFNDRIADAMFFDSQFKPCFKHPPSQAPIDDLPARLETLHLGGFFRAIGSSLDCLGGSIIGVLGLRTSLRRGDLKAAHQKLQKIVSAGNAGEQLQIAFRQFFDDAKNDAGPEDWLEWTDQYRNMFVHRGRRTSYRHIVPKDHLLFDATGRRIPRVTSKLPLARYPDKSDVEGLLQDPHLTEDAHHTLSGVFNSTRDFEEKTCARLCSIWAERRNDPSLIEQPIEQWTKITTNSFPGYRPSQDEFAADQVTINPSSAHRMMAAAADDAHRSLWDNSEWAQ